MKTIGVILSGAGFLDGAEIQESVLTLLAIDRAGATARVFAPRLAIAEVDHLTGKATGQERNALLEAARIARGEIGDLAEVQGADLDGWILPGGYGAAKTLSDFAARGPEAKVNKEVARVLREAFSAHLPVGACCIAPVVIGAAARQAAARLRLTVGNDPETAGKIVAMGHQHVDCPVDDIVIDADHKVVTTPAYMVGGARLAAVADGIDKMVRQVLAWA